MSKDDCRRLYEQALDNGWSTGEVSIAYFDAGFGMPEDLERMATNKPDADLCRICGGNLVNPDAARCICKVYSA